jgi:HD-like signal output (HDOD) protein
MRYARSPFYAYRGSIKNIADAISRVLGFTMALNLALGIATSKTFRYTSGGALGLRNVWRHMVFNATLAHALAQAMPPKRRPNPGTVYLAGLLHNFGYLLLGHLFESEFDILARTVAGHPEIPVVVIEEQLLGINHGEIGAWLMQAWNMPAEIITTARHHHNINYQGDFARYARLVLLANQLLKQYGIGDAQNPVLPEALLDDLGLDGATALSVAQRVMHNHGELDALALQMAA